MQSNHHYGTNSARHSDSYGNIAGMISPFSGQKSKFRRIYAAVPCPMKVPFQQAITKFLNKWNASTDHTPVLFPSMDACDPDSSDTTTYLKTQNPEDLPDIMIFSDFTIPFDEHFRKTFIDTGIMGPIDEEFFPGNYPPHLIKKMYQFNLGFLGYSTWGLVRDLTCPLQHKEPTSWTELIGEQYKHKIAIHGCHGHAGSLSFLLYLKQQSGINAITQFAQSIGKTGHFSELINEIGAASGNKYPYYLLPFSAISHIPNHKPIKIITLDGGMITPMMILIKKSVAVELKGVIQFFTSSEFRNLLYRNAYYQPDDIEGLDTYPFNELELLKHQFYSKSVEIQQIFSETVFSETR